jgi:hypothetical protein
VRGRLADFPQEKKVVDWDAVQVDLNAGLKVSFIAKKYDCTTAAIYIQIKKGRITRP